MKVIQVCFSCLMLFTEGLLLHLVGKRQPLVYLGASYGNGKLRDSIWESHHKSSAQGKHSPYNNQENSPNPRNSKMAPHPAGYAKWDPEQDE